MATGSQQKTMQEVADIPSGYHARMSDYSVDWEGLTFRLRPLTTAAQAWSRSHPEEDLRGLLQLQFCLAEVTGTDAPYTTLAIDGEDYRCVDMSWLKKQIPGLITALVEVCARRAGLHFDERIKLDFT